MESKQIELRFVDSNDRLVKNAGQTGDRDGGACIFVFPHLKYYLQSMLNIQFYVQIFSSKHFLGCNIRTSMFLMLISHFASIVRGICIH